MQKAMVVFVMVFICFAFESNAYSQNISDSEAEKIYLKERALSGDNNVKSPSNLGVEDFYNLLNGISSCDRGERNSTRSWFSTDSNDLKPLIGAKLVMAYKIGTTLFADVLSFGSQITTTSDGTVVLSVSNQNSSTGSVFYTDLIQGGRGFAVVITGISLTDFYYFKVNGNVANGIYLFKNNSTDTYSSQYSLTGMKWGGVIGDINGDNKIGLPEVIYDLQVISGIRTE